MRAPTSLAARRSYQRQTQLASAAIVQGASAAAAASEQLNTVTEGFSGNVEALNEALATVNTTIATVNTTLAEVETRLSELENPA